MSFFQSFACFVLLIFTFQACEQKEEPVTPPIVSQSSKFFYTLTVTNGRPIDTTTGQYVLWAHWRGDSNYRFSVPLHFWVRSPDRITFSGSIDFTSADSLGADSIDSILLSIEPMTVPLVPSSPLVSGPADAHANPVAAMTTDNTIEDFSGVTGSVLFTTTSLDTSRAKSEFYLMQLINGVPAASLTNLPPPPTGWTYGLWVLDSNFYPMHRFFYGTFTSAFGHDSDPTTDAFPYPGGFKPAALTDAGARLEITLEPTFD